MEIMEEYWGGKYILTKRKHFNNQKKKKNQYYIVDLSNEIPE